MQIEEESQSWTQQREHTLRDKPPLCVRLQHRRASVGILYVDKIQTSDSLLAARIESLESTSFILYTRRETPGIGILI